MHTISLHPPVTSERIYKVKSPSLSAWYESIKPATEENRIGIVVILMLVQVSIAGFNVVIPPMAGASIWMITPGIFLTFLSNGLALAQMKMSWVLIGFTVSMIINAAISRYYFIQLLS